MSTDLVLVTRVLVDVRRNQDGKPLSSQRQRDRALDGRAGTFCRIDNFPRRVIDQAMIERFQSNTNALVCSHFDFLNLRIGVEPRFLQKTSVRPRLLLNNLG